MEPIETTSLIPADTHLAAKRGFIRTASQSLASGFIIPAGTAFALTSEFGLALLWGLVGLVASAFANGAQSYFSIISRGIPEDYQPLIEGETVVETVVTVEVDPSDY